MSDNEQEQTPEQADLERQRRDAESAPQREQDRVDKIAAENEEVRRAEHPEEFADETADAVDDDGDDGA